MIKTVACGAAAAAFIFASAPGWAACPGGVNNPPLCETGTVVFESTNIDQYGCTKVHMAETLNTYAIEWDLAPDVGNAFAAVVTADKLIKEGRMTIRSNGLKTSCDGGKYYQIVAIRAEGF